MSTFGGLSYHDVCTKLRERAATAHVRIENTKKNEEIRQQYRARIDGFNNLIQRIEGREQLLRKNIKYLRSFVEKKRTRAIKGVYASIYNTNQILPSTGKIELVINNGEAYLNGEDGEDVNLCEASSWRAASSVHIRRAILANTDFAQVMVLDEPLSVLDDYTSAEFSLFLEPLAKECQIILIEQKDSVFANSEGITYVFEIAEGITHVRRVEEAHRDSDTPMEE